MKASFKKPITTKLSILILAGFLLCSLQSCGQEKETKPAKKTKPDYSNVDYSARSNIIKRPKELKGDEKAIFYYPYFLKLTSEEVKKLDPFKVKEEFEKLGITTKENEFKKYKEFAETDGYKVFVVVMENWHGGANIHDVPEIVLEKQEVNIKNSLKIR